MSVRRQQGEIIAQVKGSIRRLDDTNYVVNSQSGNGSYNIQLTELGLYALVQTTCIEELIVSISTL